MDQNLLYKIFFGLIAVFAVRYLIIVIQWLRQLFYYWRTVRNISGPETRPFIGSAHLIGGLENFTEFILCESKKIVEAGGGMMKIWVGPFLDVHFFDSESARAITSSNTELKKAAIYDRFRAWLGEGLITSDGEHWKKSRRLLTPAFHFGKLDEYSAVMDIHARQLIHALSDKTDGKIHNIYNPIKLATLDTIAETAMGIELNAIENPDQPYIRAVQTYLSLCLLQNTNLLYMITWYWKWLGYEKQKTDALHILKGMSSEVIRRRVQIRKEDGSEVKSRPDFLDMLITAHENGEMSFEDCREQVDNFLFAGYDTTSHAISWVIWSLACHPEIQQRVYEEIEKAFDGSDAEFVSNKIKDLSYLDAVIKESLRIFPPIPMFGRTLKNELQIGDRKLPVGLSVGVNVLLLHHNEKIFPNSWRFDPERFASGKEYAPTAYLPFSAGLRNCIGQRFANREIRIFVAHLLHNFKFTTDLNFLENRPRIEIVLAPTKGIPVRMESRLS